MKKPITLILSCEHAVNTIPTDFLPYFTEASQILDSHRGIDFGAETIADALARSFACQLIKAKTSRLLIDCNRSLHHPDCFSELTKALSSHEKKTVIETFYLPFRQQVIEGIEAGLRIGHCVWHLSIHSFTSALNGHTRNADIGLLYDPKRYQEKKMAKTWQHIINQQGKYRRVRLNYPYRGTADGFTTYLRKRFSAEDYVGIEVESNQSITREAHSLNMLAATLCNTLKEVLHHY